MKIEFKKVPYTKKNFEYIQNSVKIEGTFCKISPKLVEIDIELQNDIEVECCICGDDFKKRFDEHIEILISDGDYSVEHDHHDDKNIQRVVYEATDHFIDFDQLVESELESFKSDYHTCNNCLEKN
jgi:hypothetical protein